MTNPKDSEIGANAEVILPNEASDASATRLSDPNIEDQMEAAREGMSRYRYALKELAK